MRMLAIETATEACSVALFEGADLIAARHETIGRGHVERLVPMIAELPDRGRAAQIRVSLGPGSFTGTRVGIAAARALGIAWGADVLGYPTLALMAVMVEEPHRELLVCMAGGHGEWLVQPFTRAHLPAGDWQALAPAEAAVRYDQPLIIGSRAREFVAMRGHGEAVATLPDAAFAAQLSADLMTDHIQPIYGRAPDAKVPG